MTTEEKCPDKTIKYHEDMIQKAYDGIRHHKDEILRLQGKTEICPYCMGEGRIMTIHRFRPPHGYTTCNICHGKGKISIEEFKVYESRTCMEQ